MRTIKQQARVAGLLYFLIGITAPIGLMLVPNKLIVSGDAAATANNLRASESLFRIGIASELFHQVICIFLVFALYRLFKEVNKTLAAQVAVLGALVSVPIAFFNVVTELGALILVSTPTFSRPLPRRADSVGLFLRLHSQGPRVTSIFWGLWLLVRHSRHSFRDSSRILGYLLIAAGVGSSWIRPRPLLQFSNAISTVTMVPSSAVPMFSGLIWAPRTARDRTRQLENFTMPQYPRAFVCR
jgi:hypothetical protein